MKYLAIILGALICFPSCQEGSSEKITPEGYKYTLYEDAKGPKAKPGEYVVFDMDILDNNGEVLQSYRNRPTQPSIQIPKEDIPSPQGPNPLIGVLKLVGVGDSLALIVPIDSIESTPPQYASLEYMEYRIAIKDIQTQDEYTSALEEKRKEQEAAVELGKARELEIANFVSETLAKYKKGEFDSEIKTTETGLKYIVHEEGTGKIPEAGKMVSVQYYGVLPTDGSMFDNSFSRGQPYTFPLGKKQVIGAWDQGIALLKEGSKATLIAPPDLAYGERGSPPKIPANSSLMFYVEIEKAF
jgi:FKBP-type peptidyl-prolyl cis-trans isomerase FkpA